MKNIFYTIFQLLPVLFFAQTQIGQSIFGENSLDFFGESVAISSNGSIIAASTSRNDDNGDNSGHVKVYENINGTWTQIGDNINGIGVNDEFGRSISLSSNGNIIAVGALASDGLGKVKIYENVGGIWTQIGQDINGQPTDNFLGWDLSLSSDGNILAVSNSGNIDNGNGMIDPRSVRVYENVGGIWTQIGQDITEEQQEEILGWSIDISSDGNILVTGAISNDDNGTSSGQVRVYENIGGIWTQIGQDINGEAAFDESGRSVSISSNGEIIAIGATGNDGNGSNSGHVRVYENIGGIWTQIGADINGTSSSEAFGNSVSLSSDGSIIAVGAPGNDTNNNNSGQVQVYQIIEGVWTQKGTYINGQGAFDFLGSDLMLSQNNKLIIATLGGDENGTDSGTVKVYDFDQVLNIPHPKQEKFIIYPNPAKDKFIVKNNHNDNSLNLKIFDTKGQFVLSSSNTSIDVSELSEGVYFVEIISEKGKQVKKLIVN